MNTDDTIAAISTAIGHSGIGIVRISGSDAIRIADKLFRSHKGKKLKHTPSNRIIYGRIVEPGRREVIDEVLLSVMKAPGTYTREDIIEINCHGGAVAVRRVLELVLEYGARLAEPGEFTQRAFLNGRIDLAQAEAVLDVISALTDESQKTAIRQLSGNLSKKIDGIREKLIDLTALVEAYIDFPEDDIEPLSVKEMKKQAEAIQRALQNLIDSSKYGLILRDGLKTAIIGRPNVGKSSLLNALLEHDRAIVTELPGTTRDVIEEYLNIEGLPLKIMDTAGIRSVENIAEKEGVKRSLMTMEDADLVLVMLDGSSALHKTDLELLEKSKSKNTLLVINKTDLPQKIRLDNPPREVIRISARHGSGLDSLKKKIFKKATGGEVHHGTDIVTNVRHLKAIESASSSITSFLVQLKKDTSPEFLSLELRDALDSIGAIIGITTPDDILNRIFSSFCIGK
jgi:tRNA modification GTPase